MGTWCAQREAPKGRIVEINEVEGGRERGGTEEEAEEEEMMMLMVRNTMTDNSGEKELIMISNMGK